ncbi:hypothetical protein BJ742DRAFT_869295 [Cladochytrium replicatum]|nr:hypothetical protein BJ742DRAFT_869295 [Cladochytrium replicatum]
MSVTLAKMGFVPLGKNDKEIEIHTDDMLQIDEVDGKWITGTNLSTGQSGVFPLICVEGLPPRPQSTDSTTLSINESSVVSDSVADPQSPRLPNSPLRNGESSSPPPQLIQKEVQPMKEEPMHLNTAQSGPIESAPPPKSKSFCC